MSFSRDCRRESDALEAGDESPSLSTFSARQGLRCPPRISSCIRRGTSAPMPGQSDKLGCIRPKPDGPPSGDVGIGSDTGTSESADERRKPRGNDGTRRFEERSNGHLAWPVETAPRWIESPTRTRPLHEPETPNPARCCAGVGILALQGGEDVKGPPTRSGGSRRRAAALSTAPAPRSRTRVRGRTSRRRSAVLPGNRRRD